MKRLASAALFALVVAGIVAPAALAQRHIIGAPSDEPTDAGPPPSTAPAPAAKKKEDKKKDDKKKDDKKDKKKPAGGDILEESPEEKARQAKDAEAKDKAEKAAEEAEKKKAESERKLKEQKKADQERHRLEVRDQQLAAAKKVRQITRESGALALSFAIEPGAVHKDGLIAVRVDINEKLEVADPRYGKLMPQRDIEGLVATVSAPGRGAKLRYALHPLDAPGRYGFHMTPQNNGKYEIAVAGTTLRHKSFDVSFPLHVGVWPPPDFDEEQKNTADAEAAHGGRRILGKK